ncbi:hypothetical protein BI350_00230 [Sporosarcina ureilytica]|uniref:Uncharacterized protein n=1 Tax=Sporosarcina ureilytica TaxID=298596 RepID=A0A1D8JBY3_9BACL|nr:hypothetical protein BI350_00230 [Sporosarcina ureilytica]
MGLAKAKRYEQEYPTGCLNFCKNHRNTANRNPRIAIGSPPAPWKASARNGNQHCSGIVSIWLIKKLTQVIGAKKFYLKKGRI